MFIFVSVSIRASSALCRCDLMELCQIFLEFITKYTILGSCDFMEYTVMNFFQIFLECKEELWACVLAARYIHTVM